MSIAAWGGSVDFELGEEQAMLREASRDLLDDHESVASVRARAEDPEAPAVDPGVWRLAADLGWTGLALGEEHGGAGQGLVELAIVAEQIGRHLARGPYLISALVGRAVERSGDAALRTEVLPALADGSAWATWAFAEHGRRWDLEGITATAVPDGDDVVLHGVKTVVQDAEGAHWFLVSARADGEPTSYLVEADAPGTSVRRQRTLDATRTFAEVRLDGVRVPPGRRLGGGPADVQRVLDEATVLLAAESLGVMERMLELTVAYTAVRTQFGRPIGSFQAVKHRCASMAVLVQGARAAAYAAAMNADAADDAAAATSAAVAGAHTSAGLDDVAGGAVQLHGGIGFTWEHDLHLHLRRAKVDAALHGDADVHRERLSDLLSGSDSGTAAVAT